MHKILTKLLHLFTFLLKLFCNNFHSFQHVEMAIREECEGVWLEMGFIQVNISIPSLTDRRTEISYNWGNGKWKSG